MAAEKPQVLVTGAGGALARRVINRLRANYRIVAVDFRNRVEISDSIPSYCVDFNKRKFQDIFREHQLDGVIHLGRISAYEWNRQGRFNANVMGTQRLLDFAAKFGVTQTLVLSTYHVYGAHPYNPALLDEDAPLKAAGLALDLVDSVELENLTSIYMYKHPQLNVTVLRPCNIVGPGVRNSISLLLSQDNVPVLVGFSPMMQFIHIDDMADAIVQAYVKNAPGVYNVAPEDWIGFQEAVAAAGCRRIPVPSIPPVVPKLFSRIARWPGFPHYLMDFFKYPVILDGRRFRETFGWQPQLTLEDIFTHYRRKRRKIAA